jgi:hypothetical protein
MRSPAEDEEAEEDGAAVAGIHDPAAAVFHDPEAETILDPEAETILDPVPAIFLGPAAVTTLVHPIPGTLIGRVWNLPAETTPMSTEAAAVEFRPRTPPHARNRRAKGSLTTVQPSCLRLRG